MITWAIGGREDEDVGLGAVSGAAVVVVEAALVAAVASLVASFCFAISYPRPRKYRFLQIWIIN